MSEFAAHLRRLSGESQEKYTHFLLATTAAAIAFSVQKTNGIGVSWSQIPLGLAVASWGYSFWCGCNRLTSMQEIAFVTLDALRASEIDRGNPTKAGADYKIARIKEIESLGNVSGKYWRWQFSTLVGGGILFVAWHVGEMLLVTGGASPTLPMPAP
jgi:hypothetical protein